MVDQPSGVSEDNSHRGETWISDWLDSIYDIQQIVVCEDAGNISLSQEGMALRTHKRLTRFVVFRLYLLIGVTVHPRLGKYDRPDGCDMAVFRRFQR